MQALVDAFNAAVESSPREVEDICKNSPDLVRTMVGAQGYQTQCCPSVSTLGGGRMSSWLTTGVGYPTVRVEYTTEPASQNGCPAWRLATPIVLIAHNDTAQKVHLDYGWRASYAHMGPLADPPVDFAQPITARCDIPPHSERACGPTIAAQGTIMRSDTITAVSTGSQTGFGFMVACTQQGSNGDCGQGLTCIDFGASGKHCTWACSHGCTTPSTGCGRAGICKP